MGLFDWIWTGFLLKIGWAFAGPLLVVALVGIIFGGCMAAVYVEAGIKWLKELCDQKDQ